MALNPNIILAGQAPDIVGAMDRGAQAGQRVYQQRRNVLLDEFLGQNGAAVMQGDAGALGSLARFDPSAALGIQDQRQQMASRDLGMQNTRQSMAFDAERAAQLRAQARREAEQHAAQMDAATRQAEAQKITTILKGAASAYQRGDRAGYEGWLRQNGLDPAQYRFEDFEAHAAMQAGVLDALTGLRDYSAGPKPADEYERYVREETIAGRQPLSRIQYAQALKGKGTTFSVDPETGAVTFSQGGAASGAEPTISDAYNPSMASDAVALIDDILGSKSLGRVTGPLFGGGGNDIAEMGLAQRLALGSGGLDTVEKINQLQSRAWLSARAMLKGGGPITDYESRKAEGAVARLARAKGEDEFRAALTDLRDAITAGAEKLKAARSPAPQAASPDRQGGLPNFSTMSDEELDAYIQQNGGGNE